jgi:hypothetical protein
MHAEYAASYKDSLPYLHIFTNYWRRAMRVHRNCCGLDQVGFAALLSFFHPLPHARFIPALSESLTICPEPQRLNGAEGVRLVRLWF